MISAPRFLYILFEYLRQRVALTAVLHAERHG